MQQAMGKRPCSSRQARVAENSLAQLRYQLTSYITFTMPNISLAHNCHNNVYHTSPYNHSNFKQKSQINEGKLRVFLHQHGDAHQ